MCGNPKAVESLRDGEESNCITTSNKDNCVCIDRDRCNGAEKRDVGILALLQFAFGVNLCYKYDVA